MPCLKIVIAVIQLTVSLCTELFCINIKICKQWSQMV